MVSSLRVCAVLLASLLAVGAAACASAPPERFYALSSAGSVPTTTATTTTATATAEPEAATTGRSLVVGPAALPDIADRPQLVVHAGANRVTILEQQRWAEPLRAGIPRVVAETLSRQLPAWRISTRDAAIGTPDCRLALDLRRFDYTATATVTVHALWTLSCAGAGKQRGQSLIRERVLAASPDAVVAAYDRALQSLSGDLARSVTAAPPATP
jgi:uncharacterized lipoprotein YmbA